MRNALGSWKKEAQRFQELKSQIDIEGIAGLPQVNSDTYPFLVWSRQIGSLLWNLKQPNLLPEDKDYVLGKIKNFEGLFRRRFEHLYLNGAVLRLPPRWVLEEYRKLPSEGKK